MIPAEVLELIDQVKNLTPATREFHPGIGEGKLNQLIELAHKADAAILELH
jgi:hypothetical protein